MPLYLRQTFRYTYAHNHVDQLISSYAAIYLYWPYNAKKLSSLIETLPSKFIEPQINLEQLKTRHTD